MLCVVNEYRKCLYRNLKPIYGLLNIFSGWEGVKRGKSKQDHNLDSDSP